MPAFTLRDFHFDLPPEQIADYPSPGRSDSRLLHLGRQDGQIEHRQFRDLLSLLQPEDLLVFNDTRVIPARVFGQKPSGGKVEMLVERVLPDQQLVAQLRPGRGMVEGKQILFDDPHKGAVPATVVGREDGFFRLAFPPGLDLMALLDRIGQMPLPPYIKREQWEGDRERYQTVYAAKAGAVAAPTAGLHFDAALLEEIRQRGIATAKVTLHVGAGTFQPVRVDDLREHRMHAEYVELGEEVCAAVQDCRARGGRVVAVGTTTVRCLESASTSGTLQPFRGDTRIFIYPGYQFHSVDALITNFHLPESTLIMLVSAFSSREQVLNAYRVAVQEGYRFFSYGDAMFIA